MKKYSPAVSKLLHIKETFYWGAEWPDYLSKFGLGAEHIPELIHMATNENLLALGNDHEVEGCFHARRALAQLKATEAALPMLRLFLIQPVDEGVNEEMPLIYGKIGEGAIPALESFIGDTTLLSAWKSLPCAALRMVGEENPEAMPACLDAFLRILDDYEENTPDINGLVIIELMTLDAKETFPAICKVFAANCVDEMVVNGEDVLQWMGMDASQAPSLAARKKKGPFGGKQMPSMYGLSRKMEEMGITVDDLMDETDVMDEEEWLEAEEILEQAYSDTDIFGPPPGRTKKKASTQAKKKTAKKGKK